MFSCEPAVLFRLVPIFGDVLPCPAINQFRSLVGWRGDLKEKRTFLHPTTSSAIGYRPRYIIACISLLPAALLY